MHEEEGISWVCFLCQYLASISRRQRGNPRQARAIRGNPDPFTMIEAIAPIEMLSSDRNIHSNKGLICQILNLMLTSTAFIAPSGQQKDEKRFSNPAHAIREG